jgi:hypothetical protein
MKKDLGVKLLAVTGLTCLCLTGCFNAKEKTDIPVISPSTQDTVVEGNIETKVNTVLERMEKENLKELTAEEADKLYKFDDKEGLEIGVYTRETENDFEEVTIIKMADNSKTKDIQTAIMNRVEELKDKYKDNAEIFNILTDNKNIVVKQEGGVQTVIISKDAAALEQRLKVQF